jgi:hypothetical protein
MKFLNNLSLNGNELQNFRAQSLSGADPTGYAGRIYFNTTSNRLRYHDGTSWHDMSGDIRSISNASNGGLNVVDTAGDVTLNVVVDNSTIEISTNALRVKDLGITTAKLANSAVTTGKIADANVTLAKFQDIASNRVIGRVAAGSGVATELEVVPSGTLGSVANPTTKLATVQAIIDHVAGIVSAIGTLQGSFTGGTTNFPGTSDTKKGDYWYVTGSGTTQGIILNTGDVIIANKENPSATLPADYIFLESNRDQATETIKGVIQLATQTQANAGSDDTTAITPLKLHTWFAQSNLRSYSVLIGGATSIGVTHNLGTKDVVVQFYDAATDEAVWTDWTTTNTNTITAIFAVAPAASSYRVVVKK